MSDEIKALVERLRERCPVASDWQTPIEIEAAAALTAQADEIERLRAAVQFYAKDYNWLASSMYVFGLDGKSLAETDRGDIARAALKAAQEVKA